MKVIVGDDSNVSDVEIQQTDLFNMVNDCKQDQGH